MEPLLKGPAGFDYLRTAFGNRYGAPSEARASLPLTVEWLFSVKSSVDHEWNEHTASVSSLLAHENASQSCLPSATLRTGGSFLMGSRSTTTASSMDGGTNFVIEINFYLQNIFMAPIFLIFNLFSNIVL